MELTTLFTFMANAEEAQGIAALGIDPLAILAQAATFLVLFFVIKKYALDGIVKSLEQRRKTIDDGVRLGVEMEAEKEKLEAKIEEQLAKARKEADKIIAESHEEAGGIMKEAEAETARRVEAMLAEATNRIEEETANARAELQQEMRTLVAEATETILEEKLDTKKDASLLERALNRVRAN